MNRPSAPTETTAPAPAGKAAGTVLVRGDAFFVRRLELPAGTSAQEVAAFVQLQLEELSPFPLDQLYYGHAIATDRRAVMVYAAYRRRFPAEQTERWSEVEFVLPDFVAALRLKFPAATVVLLRTESTLAALYFEADRELPTRFASRPLAADARDEIADHVRQTVRDLVQAGGAREVAYRQKLPPTRRAQGLQFFLEPDGAGAVREVFLPGGECWAMDVRDPEYIAAQRQRQGFDLNLWRVVLGAAATIVVVLFGEILLGGSQVYVSWLRSRNASRAAEVKTLENRDAEAQQLMAFGRSGVQPFDMLTAVARVRPKTPDGRNRVTFTRITAKGSVQLEIEGMANDIASINAYESALKEVPTIESVDVKPPGSGVGGSTFKISVTFRPVESPASAVANNQS